MVNVQSIIGALPRAMRAGCNFLWEDIVDISMV